MWIEQDEEKWNALFSIKQRKNAINTHTNNTLSQPSYVNAIKKESREKKKKKNCKGRSRSWNLHFTFSLSFTHFIVILSHKFMYIIVKKKIISCNHIYSHNEYVHVYHVFLRWERMMLIIMIIWQWLSHSFSHSNNTFDIFIVYSYCTHTKKKNV